ncbi:MAG: hypothetical protein ABS46_14060 [Cytophagaceae bacterium SCN 52-12]|nr:MAG: hypothetical protein ABS46_14060 [Cytophagaceae bacterium SCN 52-12]
MKKILLLSIAFIFTTLLSVFSRETTAPPNIVYVDKNASGDGSSWENAFTELADALKWAHENKADWTAENPILIFVARGTYKPKYSPEEGEHNGTDRGRDNTFHIGPYMHLYGGFNPGGGITGLEHTRISGAGGSVLSGDFEGDDQVTGSGKTLEIINNGENAHHVVIISAPPTAGTFGSNTLLDGFTVTGGNANGSDDVPFLVTGQTMSRRGGAGISLDWLDGLTLSNLIITGNSAVNQGGGIYCRNLISSERLNVFSNLDISKNAARRGGGMYVINSTPVLRRSTISYNRADASGTLEASGGGIQNYWRSNIENNDLSNPSLEEVTITGNYAKTNGGGMYNEYLSPRLNKVTISYNTAGEDGGGIYNYDRALPVLTETNILYNTARDGGGIFNADASSPVLGKTVISDNSATRDGGGMYSRGGAAASSPTLDEVTIHHNLAGRNAGGLYFSGQSVSTLTRVTISSNEAVSSGGGIYVTGAQPVLQNVNILENKAASGGGMFNASSANPSLTDVNIEGNSAGSATSGSGGGIYNSRATPVLRNVTIRANQAAFGGGILNNDATYGLLANVLISGNLARSLGGGIYNWTNSRPVLRNVTLSGNKAVTNGGGIYNNSASGMTIENSIIWGNSNSIINEGASAPPVVTYSLVEEQTTGARTGGETGSLSTSLESIFDAPVSYELAPTAAGTYTLKVGSPAVNQGNPAPDFALFPVDENGEPVDLAGNQRVYGLGVDMGPYELIHSSALPVSLASFEAIAEQQVVHLKWATAREVDASHFEVQRSADGRVFGAIGTVRAEGDSEGLVRYLFSDHSPAPAGGLTWYRLKMVDKDGSYELSRIISVKRGRGAELKAWPNPARETVTLELSAGHIGSRVQLVSMTGVVLQEVTVKERVLSIRLDGYPAGIYLLRIADGKVAKVVKE